MTISVETAEAAWRAIGKTREGRIARALLQSTLEDVPSALADDGALRVQHGKRILAARLIALLDADIERPDAESNPTVASARPVVGARPGIARRGQPVPK